MYVRWYLSTYPCHEILFVYVSQPFSLIVPYIYTCNIHRADSICTCVHMNSMQGRFPCRGWDNIHVYTCVHVCKHALCIYNAVNYLCVCTLHTHIHITCMQAYMDMYMSNPPFHFSRLGNPLRCLYHILYSLLLVYMYRLYMIVLVAWVALLTCMHGKLVVYTHCLHLYNMYFHAHAFFLLYTLRVGTNTNIFPSLCLCNVQ